jgi:hypothetical protein
MVDMDVDWILNISIILKPTARDSTNLVDLVFLATLLLVSSTF